MSQKTKHTSWMSRTVGWILWVRSRIRKKDAIQIPSVSKVKNRKRTRNTMSSKHLILCLWCIQVCRPIFQTMWTGLFGYHLTGQCVFGSLSAIMKMQSKSGRQLWTQNSICKSYYSLYWIFSKKSSARPSSLHHGQFVFCLKMSNFVMVSRAYRDRDDLMPKKIAWPPCTKFELLFPLAYIRCIDNLQSDYIDQSYIDQSDSVLCTQLLIVLLWDDQHFFESNRFILYFVFKSKSGYKWCCNLIMHID